MKRVLVALLSLVAVPVSPASSAAQDRNSEAIFRVALAHYEAQLKSARSVCVSPATSSVNTIFFGPGQADSAMKWRYFKEDAYNRVLMVAKKHSDRAIPRHVLPTGFRFEGIGRCERTLELRSIATAEDVAFVEVDYRYVANDFLDGRTEMLALRRSGPDWTVGAVSQFVVIKN